MRVFHLATDLGPTATGKRLAILAPELKRHGIDQCIGVLDSKAHFEVGQPVVQLPLRPFVDIAGWLRLRKAIADFQPNIVHCWGRRAAEVLTVATTAAKVFKTFDGSESVFSKRIGTWLAIPPIIENAKYPDRFAARQALGLQESDRVIVAADRFEKTDPIKLAVWAVDLLKQSAIHWKLLILGDGPTRKNLERAAGKLGAGDCRARFLGVRPTIPVLAAADVVWQTRTTGGAHFVLEALSIGIPVIAAENPSLPFLNGTNCLRASDAVTIARRTTELINDDALHQQLLEAGRTTAKIYSPAPALEQLLTAYRNA